MGTKTEAKTRIEKLRTVINRERFHVHVEDRSTMSEAALDSLKKELFDLEQTFPDLITPDSPTQRVAGKPLDAFKKVTHPQRILSLNDAFSREDLAEWEKRNIKILPRVVGPRPATGDSDANADTYYCELKIDGLDMILKYVDGIFTTAATRGDGQIGEDVTQNVKTIEAIPLVLDVAAFANKFKRKLPRVLHVQGEIYLPAKEFARINREQEKHDLPKYANPRNTAAGSIRQLDPKIAASRRLSIFVFNILSDLGQQTHAEIHDMATALGFTVEPHSSVATNLKEVEKYLQTWEEKRKKTSYQTDGAVIQVNAVSAFRDLGVVGKAPRGAIAFKFPAEEATTKVLGIEVSIGRTAALTPIAIMTPVLVAGSTVSRASLHNADEVRRLDIRIGDTVIIRKAGDIIPEVVRVLKKLRTGKEKIFYMPKVCPMCGGKVIRREGEVAHYCDNLSCFAIDRERVIHFVSKGGLNIEFVGPKLIDKLFDAELIKDSADLFELKQGDLEGLENFGPVAAKRVLVSLDAVKHVDLGRLLFALGIRHVGGETAQDVARFAMDLYKKQTSLAKKNPTLSDLLTLLPTLSADDWKNVGGIGEVVAESLANYFSVKSNLKMLERLASAGIEIYLPKQQGTKLAGKTFVITGTLTKFSRESAKQKITTLGGSVATSVSAHTDYLVVGEKPGSKLTKARELGITVLDEKVFSTLVS